MLYNNPGARIAPLPGFASAPPESYQERGVPMTIQLLLVILAIAAAAVYLIVRLAKRSDGGGCCGDPTAGCSGCKQERACDQDRTKCGHC